MKQIKQYIRTFALLLLLLVGGITNHVWATDVTYHILTLPIDNTIYHMKSDFNGKRLEAFKVVMKGQSQLELPAHFKSPLATGFTYYAISDPNITKSGSALKLFDATNNSNKAYWYTIGGSATPVAEGTALTGQSAEYYVVYTYNEASNTIAKLNGSVKYNLSVKNKGFLSLNRGRNNRPAVVPKGKVDAQMLASEDFMYINNPGAGIATYWDGKADQKNKKEDIESQFHFIFQFEGVDPYNIIIRTAYDKNTTYIEKNDNTSEFVYKYYKESSFFTNSTAKGYFASDEHRHYNYTYDSNLSENPTNLVQGAAGTHTGYDATAGYYHGQKGSMWNSFALLNNSDKTGYVFIGTRTTDGSGNIPGPTDDGKYYYLKLDNNDLFIAQQTTASVSNNYTIEGIYPVKTVTFKVKTPFYGTDGDNDGHTVSATANISQYTIDNDNIDEKFIPDELRRKYCTFTTTYRNSDGDVITKYSDMKSDGIIYLEYNVSESIPFKAITPASSYDANTWKSATWYELTDEGSTQADGKKLEFNSPNFMNNGDAGDYQKTSEYAFIGDPYELRVVYRNATSGASPVYVGVASVSTGTPLTTSTTASAGYKWEMPEDATAGSFILRNYKDADKGCWRWDTDHINETRSYATKSGQVVSVTNSEAQTITLNITDFAGGDGHYFKMTVAGDNLGQVDSSDPVLSSGMGAIIGTEGTATITLKSSGGVAKSFTLSIQEYNLSNVAQGEPCVITVNQGTTPYTGHNIEYSTTGSTRVKVMKLPEFDYTYNIIDMAGTIAIQATVKQPIYSPLSGYNSIPELIRSPFLADETMTYYRAYSGGDRDNLNPADIIDEIPKAAANIYISYTLANLSSKNIKLDDSQRFKVKLNDEYIYVSGSTILSTPEAAATEYYSWHLLGQDPYAMIIKNVGKNEYVRVHEGTWGDKKVLDFDATIGNASRFVAMMGNYMGEYEVLAATGNTNYYHIGRSSSSGAETKVYSTTTYDHGADELRFELAGEDAITYHLIDKSNSELLTVQSYNPRLTLPAEYVSPLVETYYYYKSEAGAIAKDPDDRITEITQDNDNNIYVTYDVNDLIGFNNSGRIDDHPYLLRFLQPFEEGYYLENGSDKLTSSKLKAIYPYCNGDGSLNIYGEKMRNEQMGGGSSTRSRWVWFFESSNNDPYHVKIHSRNTIAYNSVDYPTYLQTSAVHFKQDADPNTKHIVTGGALPGIASATATEYMILGIEGQYRLKTTHEIEGARRDVKTLEQYWKTYNMIKLEMLGILATEDAFSSDQTTWVVPANQRAGLKTRLQAFKYTAENESDMETQINSFTSTGVYYFRIGTSTYTYKKITVTTVATTEPVAPAVYESEDCSASTWEGSNYVDGWVWHSYDEYAYAVRWNGYNDKEDGGHTKKVAEKIEHWYQTFDMGNGTFNVETAIIPPVLVLLDRHGWEIMRKPLPAKSTYPNGDELKALRAYDSPMVKEYKFYSNATKASGCHKYSLRLDDKTKAERDQIKVGGVQYKSSSLAELPPLTASGVQSSGVLNDQYVTYTVKDEYEDNYDYDLTLTPGDHTFTERGVSQPYLVLQNGRFYKTLNTENTSYLSKPIFEHATETNGNVFDMIVSPRNNTVNIIDGSGDFIGNNFWYVKPNLDIDEEMGITWGESNDTTKAEPLSKYGTREKYEKKTGFDPYNIQIQLVNDNNGDPDGRYLTTHMTSTSIVNGAMVGDYSGSGGTIKITLEGKCVSPVSSEGYDHSTMQITNQTFMAVSDANDNIQLMPRFDHSLRVDLANTNPWETHLKAPKDNKKASADDNSSMGSQTTFFVRPQRIHYHIIDNYGREALRYKRGGDFYPAITDHFKSPLAKDFTYYTGLADHGEPTGSSVGTWNAATGEFKRTATTEALMNSLINLLPTAGTYEYRVGTRGNFTYYSVEVTKGLLEKEITGSIAAANVDGVFDGVDCDVYVRYNYDEDADHDADRILQGQWFTVKLSEKDLQANGSVTVPVGPTQGTGVNLYAGADDSRSLTAEDNDEYKEKRDALPQIGDYYFRIGEEESYTYNKVEVTAVSPLTYTETIGGSFATEWSNSKPLTVDADGKKWQWKFLQAPADPSSDYYETPDPYAIQIFNRHSNYTINPSLQPSPMAIGIKVPNANDGANRFVLLSHPSGGYALAVAKEYPNDDYYFLNGANMSVPTTTAATTYSENRQKITVANAEAYATAKTALGVSGVDGEYYYKYSNGGSPETFTYKKVIVTSGVISSEDDSDVSEWNTSDTYRFTYKDNKLSAGTQLLVSNDVTHNFEYHVINNSSKLAVSDNQTTEEAASHEYFPYLPEAIQTPLLNISDYKYYGFATPGASDTYSVIPQTILYTLAGLYDDEVWVRYEAYDMDKSPFKVPNKRNLTSETTVARADDSQDASMNINGGLPYNIIWENDDMMKADGTSISNDADQDLSGDAKYVWLFEGNDPYNLKIKHKNSVKYIYSSDVSSCSLDDSNSTPFMLLKKSGYDYGILQVTGGTKALSGYGNILEASDATHPNKFIIFGLSVHDLIYRLIIARTCTDSEKASPEPDQYVEIPCKGEAGNIKRIYGTTQRDLESGFPAGATYQLGETINIYDGSTTTPYNYCVDAGAISIGDLLQVPNEFNRPNCTYEFYIDGVWDSYNSATKTISDANGELNTLYKGEKLNEESPRLMSDASLINKVVRVNIVYKFNTELATNSGLDFVKSTGQNLWYTYETQSGETPYLAHYTNAWGMQSMEGRNTRYTNDYLWTPLGDVYGFKMYNRYMIKNSGANDKVMTFAGDAAAGKRLVVAKPGDAEAAPGIGVYTLGNEIFELLSGDDPNSGYFRVHPVANTGETKFYVIRNSSNDNYTELSTTPCDWTFGLDMSLLEPYYVRAGYVGGLNDTGKAAYKTEIDKGEGNYKITDLQNIVYNDANIVDFSAGYYRLHSVPGTSGISPVRYASGYLHDIERDQDKNGSESDAIPMHFYSKAGVTGTFDGDTNPLESDVTKGFTETPATRGDIPVPATEYDPSTIFYLDSNVGADPEGAGDPNPRVIMSTQGLYVKGNSTDENHGDAVMTATEGNATKFSLIDIGGAVLLITNKLDPGTRNYIHYGQDYTVSGDNKIYDLKYYHNSPTNEARWCIEPANNKGLQVAVNNGGDGYYYSTFYAPYDVLLPTDDKGVLKYDAYTCDEWNTFGLSPKKVPEVTGTPSYAEGKFVPAGTPVIIRTNDESGSLKLTLPSDEPTTESSISCVFSGEYLEQMLGAGLDVYTLGLPFTSNVEKAGNYNSTGNITAPLPEQATLGLGFYINANPNKENNAMKANWSRNNRYVLHNKIYYRASVSPAPAMSPEFVPVLFGDPEEGSEELNPNGTRETIGDGCVYDLAGRKVASKEEVIDGTWRQRVARGVYIVNGKKIAR